MVASVRSIEPGTQSNLLGCSFAERSAAELWRGYTTWLKTVFSRHNRAPITNALPAMRTQKINRGLPNCSRSRVPNCSCGLEKPFTFESEKMDIHRKSFLLNQYISYPLPQTFSLLIFSLL